MTLTSERMTLKV